MPEVDRVRTAHRHRGVLLDPGIDDSAKLLVEELPCTPHEGRSLLAHVFMCFLNTTYAVASAGGVAWLRLRVE